MSHTVLTHSKQHLHNKKRRPNREHRCGAGQIPSEGQVRTSHNSRVLERGKLCVPWFVRVLRLLQQQGINIPQPDQKSFPFRNLLEAYFTGSFPYGNPFGFCKAWRASYFLIHSMRWWQANIGQYRRLVITLQFSLRHFTKASAPLWASIPSRR